MNDFFDIVDSKGRRLSEVEIAEIQRWTGKSPKEKKLSEKSQYEIEVEKAHYQRWHDKP